MLGLLITNFDILLKAVYNFDDLLTRNSQKGFKILNHSGNIEKNCINIRYYLLPFKYMDWSNNCGSCFGIYTLDEDVFWKSFV